MAVSLAESPRAAALHWTDCRLARILAILRRAVSPRLMLEIDACDASISISE